MRYRTLGRTGLAVSVVGLGTYQFGGEWGQRFDRRAAQEILGTARDCGINLIDTAECYGDHLAEELIGAAIRGERSHWIIATKFGHRFHGFRERSGSWRPGEVRRQLDRSLRALGTDHVDLYQFHSPVGDEFLTEGLWERLAREKEAGRIRHIGISVASSACAASDTSQLDRAPEVPLEAAQVVYNRLDRRVESAVLPACRRLGLGVLARVPLASGLLSGKYDSGHAFAPDDVRAYQSPDATEGALAEVRRLEAEELPAGVPMAAWALAWCLKQPAVTAVIPGCKSRAQVLANAAAADLVKAGHPQEAK
ncbi:MAG: aldo/keto reductase [Spirochaetales bacterium]|nr:aldo/keto reductase [Spirochaetales bacterium]